jgi:acetyl esterase/lipase
MPADPPVPLNLVEQHRATVSPGAVVTSALFPERGDLMACVLQHALAYELLGGDPDMNLVALLGHIKTPPPPTWLFHGTDDANVDFAETRAFAARVKDVYGPDVQLKETYVPGAHGVGNDDSMDGGWIRDGLEWIGQYWR